MSARTWLVIKWISLAVACLALLGSLSVAAIAVEGSRACVSCHAMSAHGNAHDQSTHASTTCGSCHGGGGPADRSALAWAVGARMIPGALAGVAEPPRDTVVADESCLRCHQKVMGSPVEGNGLRIDHGFCIGEGVVCAECHGDAGHKSASTWRRSYQMGDCVSCHSKKSATLKCDGCHKGRRTKDRVVDGPWQVTHGREWRKTHGMGDLATCSACHQTEDCVECHGTPLPHPVSFSVEHGVRATSADAKCSQCHDKQSFCNDCHGVDMPHASDFIIKHSSVASDTSDPRCSKCHDTGDCSECHTKHVHPGGAKMPASEKGGE